jgi:hypothetical protein
VRLQAAAGRRLAFRRRRLSGAAQRVGAPRPTVLHIALVSSPASTPAPREPQRRFSSGRRWPLAARSRTPSPPPAGGGQDALCTFNSPLCVRRQSVALAFKLGQTTQAQDARPKDPFFVHRDVVSRPGTACFCTCPLPGSSFSFAPASAPDNWASLGGPSQPFAAQRPASLVQARPAPRTHAPSFFGSQGCSAPLSVHTRPSFPRKHAMAQACLVTRPPHLPPRRVLT